MHSYGGFYVTPDDWADWLSTRTTLPPPHGAADAEIVVEEVFQKQKIAKYLEVTMVPIPPSEPKQPHYALMIYRQFSKKRKYLPPRAEVDLNGPAVLGRLMGLKVSEWRTIWFNDDSVVSPYEAEFLKPEPSNDKNQASGNKKGRRRKTIVNQSGESSSGSSPKVGGERNEDQPTCENQL